MIWASRVAVVVPSPATSLVAVATSRTSCAPWLSNTSSISISRAIVTPSFVIVGAPNFLSRTTYRPLGPSVTLTALATASTPASRALRASASYLSSLCAMRSVLPWRLGLDLGEHVGLAQNQQVLAVDLDLGAAVLAVEDLVALRDVERHALLAVLVPLAIAHRDDLALLGLLLGCVGEHETACSGLLLLDCPHDQSIAEGLELHLLQPPLKAVGSLVLALTPCECQLTPTIANCWHSRVESAKKVGESQFWAPPMPCIRSRIGLLGSTICEKRTTVTTSSRSTGRS